MCLCCLWRSTSLTMNAFVLRTSLTINPAPSSYVFCKSTTVSADLARCFCVQANRLWVLCQCVCATTSHARGVDCEGGWPLLGNLSVEIAAKPQLPQHSFSWTVSWTAFTGLARPDLQANNFVVFSGFYETHQHAHTGPGQAQQSADKQCRAKPAGTWVSKHSC